MVKIVAMKKSTADRAAEKKAMGTAEPGVYSNPEDDEGPHIRLEHHHLTNMGIGGGLKSGDKVRLEGEGHVEESESRMHQGEPRHSARIRMKKMGVELKSPHGDEDERAALRNDIEKAHGESAKGKDEGTEKRGLKGAESGKKAPEKKETY
jgi:hypothetical protein